ncbi:MAG: hypothetical protein ABR570_13795 [Burkholderiales bacterium]
MRIDYVERQAFYLQARRQRAEAVYTLLIAPLVRLFSRRARPAAGRAARRHAHA